MPGEVTSLCARATKKGGVNLPLLVNLLSVIQHGVGGSGKIYYKWPSRTDYNVRPFSLAVLREEFRLEPTNTRVAQGETALMECGPPRGTPEPIVSWRKNGQTLDMSGSKRIRLVDGGNLAIQDARQSDDGRYQCIVRNPAGVRESAVAFLKVHGKFWVATGQKKNVSPNLTPYFFSHTSKTVPDSRAAEPDVGGRIVRDVPVSRRRRTVARCAVASHRVRRQYATW